MCHLVFTSFITTCFALLIVLVYNFPRWSGVHTPLFGCHRDSSNTRGEQFEFMPNNRFCWISVSVSTIRPQRNKTTSTIESMMENHDLNLPTDKFVVMKQL